MDNSRLAEFIASFGSLNDYGSTVAQTKKALDTGNLNNLSRQKDIDIFKDALSGINIIQKVGFNVDGIIAVNKKFTHSEDEDPDLPGHLRNAMYNSDDNIAISIDNTHRNYYFRPETVTKQDLEKIVTTFKKSNKSRLDGLKVFADIAKLQPFQDGNKRTALIVANSALNTWTNENYLLVPLNDLDRADFTINLMRYYQCSDKQQAENLLKHMERLIPSNLEQKSIKPSISKENLGDLSTVRVKPLFRKKNGRER